MAVFSYKASDKAKILDTFSISTARHSRRLKHLATGALVEILCSSRDPVWLQLLVYESLNSPSEPRLSGENYFCRSRSGDATGYRFGLALVMNLIKRNSIDYETQLCINMGGLL